MCPYYVAGLTSSVKSVNCCLEIETSCYCIAFILHELGSVAPDTIIKSPPSFFRLSYLLWALVFCIRSFQNLMHKTKWHTYQKTEMAMSPSLGHNYRVESKFRAELVQLIGFCLRWEKFWSNSICQQLWSVSQYKY